MYIRTVYVCVQPFSLLCMYCLRHSGTVEQFFRSGPESFSGRSGKFYGTVGQDGSHGQTGRDESDIRVKSNPQYTSKWRECLCLYSSMSVTREMAEKKRWLSVSFMARPNRADMPKECFSKALSMQRMKCLRACLSRLLLR